MQSREEGLALAVQLAECKERTRQAENSADDAHDESRALREQMDEAESQLQQMEQKLVDTAASCRRYVPGLCCCCTPLKAAEILFTCPGALEYTVLVNFATRGKDLCSGSLRRF